MQELKTLIDEIEPYDIGFMDNMRKYINREDFKHFGWIYGIYSTPRDFFYHVLKEINSVNWMKLFLNLSTLLDNCVDKNLDHLDFNQDIKNGMRCFNYLEEHDPETLNKILSEE